MSERADPYFSATLIPDAGSIPEADIDIGSVRVRSNSWSRSNEELAICRLPIFKRDPRFWSRAGIAIAQLVLFDHPIAGIHGEMIERRLQ